MVWKGWMRTSLIDFPGRIATVLFVGGCNFRCPMCHNADLVVRAGELPDVPEEEVWAFLERRQGLIDGVVVTGGEPTLHKDLPAFLRRVREKGLAIKLDTNGYRPEVLRALVDEGLVDYVAMDVKAPPEKYALLSGRADLDLTRVEESIRILLEGRVDYELRTTVVPGWLDAEDVEAIARWIAGACRYVLQAFRPTRTLDPELERLPPCRPDRLEAMRPRVEPWVDELIVRV